MPDTELTDAQRRWASVTEWPLTITAIVFLIAYAWDVLARLDGVGGLVAELVIDVTWVAFAVDYVVMLVFARRRRVWFVRHLVDLAIVALPLLRPLRLLRLVTVLKILQVRTGRLVRGRVVAYTVAASGLLIFAAALAVLDAERSAGGAIEDFGDALWWAFATVTTVGYGDFAPVTFVGRLTAVGLMIGGIALIGVVTATLASWIVERVSETTEAEASATIGQIAQLSEQVERLRAELAERAPLRPPRTPSDDD